MNDASVAKFDLNLIAMACVDEASHYESEP